METTISCKDFMGVILYWDSGFRGSGWWILKMLHVAKYPIPSTEAM